MNVFKVARITLEEARMRKIVWAIVLLGLAFLIIFGVGFYFMYRDVSRFNQGIARVLEPVNFFVLAGLYGINFLVVVLALLMSVDTIAGEVASGTIQTLVTKPLRRWEVVVGKWLGLGLLLAAFTVILSGSLTGLVAIMSGYIPANLPQAVGLMVLEGLVVLSLSLLGGTRLPALANGVVIFMFYGLAFIAGWIEQIGSYLQNEAAVNIGIIVSLFLPIETMWKRAAYILQPPFLRELGFDASPFGAASAPSPLMVWYAAGYTVLMLLLAIRSFNRRDL
jgi:Cu-processing system permease protein